MHLKNKKIDRQYHPMLFYFLSKRHILNIGFWWLYLFLILGCAHGPTLDPQANLFEDTLQIYRGPLKHLSAVRRGVCPMHPSCSEYGRQSVRKHGFLIGWAMTMDRLLRCGRSELKHSQRIWVAGDWKYYDPVSANDSWWYPKRSQEAVSE